ncbi:MAG: hypothetical protein U0269_18570 [Polyangiales bacterium]
MIRTFSVHLNVCAFVIAASSTALAQAREPLCRTVETRRLHSHRSMAANLAEAVFAAPVLQQARDGAKFVVVWRESRPMSDGGTAVRFARVDSELRRVGAVTTITVAAMAQDDGPGALSIASLPSGTLVLFRSGSGMYASLISADGVAASPRELFSVTGEVEGSRNRVVWSSAIERGDGAIALVGSLDGAVRALRFDRAGAVTTETTWTQRVGGLTRLLPSHSGPVSAFLERALPGVGPNGEQPALQMLVTLDERLLPVAVPERTGFAQFPWAAIARGSSVEVSQWASQGVAIGRLPVSARRVGVESPRLWYAQPAFAGIAQFASALHTSDAITYAMVVTGGAMSESHLAWIPPSGEPMLRRNVVPVFGTVIGAPALVPAQDGFVAMVAHNDEAGFALDAHHVHCELVTRSQ